MESNLVVLEPGSGNVATCRKGGRWGLFGCLFVCILTDGVLVLILSWCSVRSMASMCYDIDILTLVTPTTITQCNAALVVTTLFHA